MLEFVPVKVVDGGSLPLLSRAAHIAVYNVLINSRNMF